MEQSREMFYTVISLWSLIVVPCHAKMQLTKQAANMPKYDEEGGVIPAFDPSEEKFYLDFYLDDRDDQFHAEKNLDDREDQDGDGIYPTDLDLKISKFFFVLGQWEINNADKLRHIIKGVKTASIVVIAILYSGVALTLIAITLMLATQTGRTSKRIVASLSDFVTRNQERIFSAVVNNQEGIMNAIQNLDTSSVQ